MPSYYRVQIRRGDTDFWDSVGSSFIPLEGEPCYNIDTNTLRIGDGKNTYKDLSDLSNSENGVISIQPDIDYTGTITSQGCIYIEVTTGTKSGGMKIGRGGIAYESLPYVTQSIVVNNKTPSDNKYPNGSIIYNVETNELKLSDGETKLSDLPIINYIGGNIGNNNEIFNDYENNKIINNVSYAHVEGQGTIANKNAQHVEGRYNKIDDGEDYAHIVGNGDSDTQRSNAYTLDWKGNAEYLGSITANNEKSKITKTGIELYGDNNDNANVCISNDGDIIISGDITLTKGNSIKFTDGDNIKDISEVIALNIKNGKAEGSLRTYGSKNESDEYTLGIYAFSEGFETKAPGLASHSEGDTTLSKGDFSHAEGYSSQSLGKWSHAEGRHSRAKGDYSHAEGEHTIASGLGQHVEGRYNEIDDEKDYAHIVGNGDSDTQRSNAYTLDWEGNGWYAGGVSATGLTIDGNATVSEKLTVYNTMEVDGDIKLSEDGTITIGDKDISEAIALNIKNGKAEGSLRTVGSKAESDDYKLGTHAFVAGGQNVMATGNISFATNEAKAYGHKSHAEGNSSTGFLGISLICEEIITDNSVYNKIRCSLASNDFNLLNDKIKTTDTWNIRLLNSPAVAHECSNIQIEFESDTRELIISVDINSNIDLTVGKEYVLFTPSDPDFGNISVSYHGTYSHSEGEMTTAHGYSSHAEGYMSHATGRSSHAEGHSNTASGDHSHAEGTFNTASGERSHVEGTSNISEGFASHAEGRSTEAIGQASHAEGYDTIANGHNSHAEGYETVAEGYASHAEGRSTEAIGQASHAEGYDTIANGHNSHAEGHATEAIGQASHVEGYSTIAEGGYSHAEGYLTKASGDYSHAEGRGSKTGVVYGIPIDPSTYLNLNDGDVISELIFPESVNVEKINRTYAYLVYGTLDNTKNKKIKIGYTINDSNSINIKSVYSEDIIYNDGDIILCICDSDCELPLCNEDNVYTVKLESENSISAHVEGTRSIAYNSASHAEGGGSFAIGNYSHAEGRCSIACGQNSHAEGHGTISYDGSSHAEGYFTKASGIASHVEGFNNISIGYAQHVEGRYNEIDTIKPGSYYATYAHIVGNGDSDTQRSNAYTLDWEGNGWYAGGVTIEGDLIVNGAIKDIYPIGSIYMSTTNTSPASIFGGTWESLQNRFLIGAGNTYSVGTTGGSTSSTLPSTFKTDNSPSGTYGWSWAAGGGSSIETMPPYLAVYMWKRVS